MANEFRNSGSIICEPGNLAENGEENHYKTYLMKKKLIEISKIKLWGYYQNVTE